MKNTIKWIEKSVAMLWSPLHRIPVGSVGREKEKWLTQEYKCSWTRKMVFVVVAVEFSDAKRALNLNAEACVAFFSLQCKTIQMKQNVIKMIYSSRERKNEKEKEWELCSFGDINKSEVEDEPSRVVQRVSMTFRNVCWVRFASGKHTIRW